MRQSVFVMCRRFGSSIDCMRAIPKPPLRPALLLVLSIALCANVAAQEFDLEELGITLLEQREEAGKLHLELVDSDGNKFTVVSTPDIAGESVAKIGEIKDGFFAWEDVVLDSVMFVAEKGKELEIIIKPGSYVYNGQDLNQYMPSGMVFYYGENLYFDFRMMKENLFLRFTGRWINADEFGKKIVSALENPLAYNQTRSFEFYLAKFGQHDKAIDDLMFVVDRHKRQYATDYADAQKAIEENLSAIGREQASQDARHNALERAHEGLSARYDDLRVSHRELTGKHEALEASHQQLDQRHEELKTSHEGLSARHEKLLDAHEELLEQFQDLSERYAVHVEEFEKARYANLVMHNEILFWTYQVDRDAIKTVIEMKEANPEWTKKEINEALKETEIKLTDREVYLILAIYFNQFDE